MKILLIGSYSDESCIPAPLKVANSLFREFANKEHHVKYFTYFDDGFKYTRIQKFFGKEKIANRIYRFGIFPLLRETISFKPDIIQIVNAEAFYLPIYSLKIILNVKIIYLAHSNVEYLLKNALHLDRYSKYRLKTIEFFNSNFSDRILVLSRRESFLYYKRLKKKGSLIVVDNGVSEHKIIKTNFKYSKPFKIILIGSFYRKEKGIDILINTLEQLGLDLELTICSYDLNSVEDYKFNKNILINLKYGLNENDVLCEIRSNDLLIVPSKYEPFSLALLEGMSTGTLFLTTSRVGFSERLPKELKRFIYDINNEKELLYKIIEIINMDLNEKVNFSNMIKDFSIKFSWNEVADKYLKIYTDILNGK
ncbi:MAG: glycosyltransferase family 4 protein [Melioribacteraceae bacterium]|nr:glycosyltransferase family 4 protein [Melioribacteraceae bacterium]